MPTAEDMCRAQCEAFTEAGLNGKVCTFGAPNPNAPGVVFTGCPACNNKVRDGWSIERAKSSAAAFITGLKVRTPGVGRGQ